MIRKAIFPVAGMGTRILPATKAIPKELLPVIDKPLIQYAVEEALAAGIEQIIFVTGQGKSALEDHFDFNTSLVEKLKKNNKKTALETIEQTHLLDGKIVFVRQSRPLGLGHAVWCARHLVGHEPFAVILPDDYCIAKTPVLKQMVNVWQQEKGNLVAILDVKPEETAKYGIIKPGKTKNKLVEVCGLIEKPQPHEAPSTLSIIGRYILHPDIFIHLEDLKPGSGNEIQLTDAMLKMVGFHSFHGFHYAGHRYDCGDRVGYIKATLATALEDSISSPEICEFINQHIVKSCSKKIKI